MYLLIPILALIVSLAGIIYIVQRKFVYLKKLTPEAINEKPRTMADLWRGLFPEIASWLGKINWREYRIKITAESEKILRKMRLVFLKIDTLTQNLVNYLRRSQKHHEKILERQETEEYVEESEISVQKQLDPKEEEQRLIMEIAQNPKDPILYLKLGDIYLKTGDKENARMSFETVLQLDPQNWYAKKKVQELRPE